MKRILIVDDSELMCEVIRGALRGLEEDNVIFVATNPLIAIRKANLFKIDLALIDYEMPYMNGILLIDYLKDINPLTKILMVSAYTEPGAQITLEALNRGAIDYILKPANKDEFNEFKKDLLEKVKGIIFQKDYAFVNIKRTTTSEKSEKKVFPVTCGIDNNRSHLINKLKESKVIAIGISTGGPPVLEKIFTSLNKDFSIPILVVQHMPPTFTKALAERLSKVAQRQVKEAEDREKIENGVIYIAKGGTHLAVEKILGKYYVRLLDNIEKVNNHKPSCDILFSSVAEWYGENATGIIMTGMGSDGANGLFEMKKQGALTIAQSKESCVVFGMPRVAIEKGAAEVVLSVEEIIDLLNRV
ncbi:response regulator receiver modulated CheB methylesterase [Caldicellulosiruptor obsidiansis OB47]|uniref:Protein-glutamate methylesterase/protein-glutamine glutaminase n=1 Tax=Caldicellulosiruptor obsidiansis (strain ATCC BAA-2073 / JCM 16842 / OB47) TaxID=608506 RepID=D9THY3_CALOO|nr:chemotaxis-specific protein-glutamate methyltransferase CheB [Caldicellulosiruptor obsidiansis]ADL41615.1 response regulator receiver modulated CheB methylesterase [Caldicellulosiruptor obsidiansis OB47]